MGYFFFFSPETWSLLLLSLTLILVYGYWPYGLFKSLRIPGPIPLPYFGALMEYRKGFFNFDVECFKKYGKLWGFYEARQPVLAITDPVLIKTILVKECYSIFTNRNNLGLTGQLYDAVTVAQDDTWKRIRSVLSPLFTSGRLKEMFTIMKKHSNTLVKNLHKMAEKTDAVEIKQFFGAYSMDIVTSTAFSVDIDSLNNPKDPFVTNIKKFLQFDFLKPLFLFVAMFPFMIPVMEKMNFTFTSKSVEDFFYSSFRKIKGERQSKGHKTRVDFLQVMMDSQIEKERENESAKGLTDHEILSQSMIFIFAGYETSSSTLSFLSYNLATNPKIMKRLQNEIDEVFPNKAPVTYEELMQMEYLDMVLNETLRMFPIAPRLQRICKKTVEINGLTIPKGTVIMIPTFAMHRDPEIWTEPEVFNPERFSKENKDSIDPYVYMPFGAGPRNCIGMRFAIVLIKLAIVEILQNFDIVPSKETKVPIELSKHRLLKPKTPIRLKLIPR